MRILVFVEQFSPISETFVFNQVKELSRHHLVKVVSFNRINEDIFPFDNYIEIKNPHSKIHDFVNARMGYFSYKKIGLSPQFDSIIQTFSPNIIYCFFGEQALHLIDNIPSLRVPIFIIFLGYDVGYMLNKSIFYRRRMRKLLAKDKIYPIFVSSFLKKEMKKVVPEMTKESVIPLSVNVDFFSRRQFSFKAPYQYVQVSRFVEKKGHYFTILAFKKLLEHNPKLKAHLTFVGEGPLLRTMQDMVNNLDLNTCIRFVGALPSKAVQELLDQSHIFVLHSVQGRDHNTEGMPVVILEAMAMEMPIVSTIHAGIPEVVKNGENGYLSEEKDIESFAANMQKALGLKYLTNNREKIIEEFSLRKQVGKLRELFRSTIA